MDLDAFLRELHNDLCFGLLSRAEAMRQVVERLQQDNVPGYLLKAADIMHTGHTVLPVRIMPEPRSVPMRAHAGDRGTGPVRLMKNLSQILSGEQCRCMLWLRG